MRHFTRAISSIRAEKLDGANHYALRFAPGQLPPVNAFWSLTLYELPSSLLYANPLNRYLINSAMLPDLKRDADGGITLYVQNAPPGGDKEANWLPAPKGPFIAVMRLYWPKKEALDGEWKSPPLQRVAEEAKSANSIPARLTTSRAPRAISTLATSSRTVDFGKFTHRREPAAIDKQTVIRLNRDTLYSAAIFDLDAGPGTVTLPDAGKRFMSMQLLDEDEYTPQVIYGAGSYTLAKEKISARYVLTGVRILVDPANPKDMETVHALQDAIKVDQPGGPGKFETPQWNLASQKKVRDALLVLAATLPQFKTHVRAKSGG